MKNKKSVEAKIWSFKIPMLKRVLFFIGILVVLSGSYLSTFNKSTSAQEPIAQNVSVKVENPQILTSGEVTSANLASLHFQTSGKLVYLPFKEGDHISQGQVIAQIDSYPLQDQLKSALNTYRSTRDTFDQTQANSNTGVLQGAQKYTLETQNKIGLQGQDEVNVINDIVKRIVDQNQASLDNSIVNVELANYAISLSTITSPIDGVMLHEDTTVSGINITPQTTFIVADPKNLVFQAQVSDSDINFISPGNQVTIRLDSQKDQTFTGVVSRIYPEKVKTQTGESAYRVDIASNDLAENTLLAATGTVTIQSNLNDPTVLVPSWLVINNHYLWVLDGNKPKLAQVKVGENYGQVTAITEGLDGNSRVITDPKSILSAIYKII